MMQCLWKRLLQVRRLPFRSVRLFSSGSSSSSSSSSLAERSGRQDHRWQLGIREDARDRRSSGKQAAEKLHSALDRLSDLALKAAEKGVAHADEDGGGQRGAGAGAAAPRSMVLPRNAKEWTMLVEQRIQEAMNAGEFRDLKGKGKPFPDTTETDAAYAYNDEDRFAHKILRNHSFAPPWIELDKMIREDLAAMDAYVARVLVAGIKYLGIHRGKHAIQQPAFAKDVFPSLTPEEERVRMQKGDVAVVYKFAKDELEVAVRLLESSNRASFATWDRVLGECDELTKTLNRKIDDYNIMTPVLSSHKMRRNRERNIKAALRVLDSVPIRFLLERPS
eukprot:ANDGO_06288.mRNA.1 nucleobase:cation symporter-1